MTNIIYGDTSGTLFCEQVGGDQTLIGPSATSIYETVVTEIHGDAQAMQDFARGGNDFIIGGSATNLVEEIYGDAYVMSGFSQGGNDSIFGGRTSGYNHPVVYGDAQEMHDNARGGSDWIVGNDANVYGDALGMDGFAVGGNDCIMGSSTNTSLYGDARALRDHAQGGNDLIWVTAGTSLVQIYGDGALSGFARGGNDRIIGPAASVSCIIQGDGRMSDNAVGGDDVIVAGAHSSNQIWGDGERTGGNTVGGSDTFVFAPGIAQNRIMDFGQGQDHIDLTAFASIGVHDLGDLSIRSGSISLPGGPSYTGSLITFGTDSYIALVGVEHPAGSDFIFA
ncbi:hypothetical protein ACX4MT_04675 [Roseomonas mucosa]